MIADCRIGDWLELREEFCLARTIRLMILKIGNRQLEIGNA
jgi:hypothetical protein